MIALRLRREPDVPLEAESITPDVMRGRSIAEIERLPLLHGNRAAVVGDFFSVSGEADDTIRLEGDLGRVKHLGHAMTGGRIEIRGNAGMHLGAEMRGGEIAVHGDVGDWAGAEMRGGLLRVHGNAGHLTGAAYRGSPRGMRGGTILVDGNVGNEVGCVMRRGLIVVKGDAGDFAGVMMLAGTIIVLGALGLRAGAGLKRGTIVTHAAPSGDGRLPFLLPTFKLDCEYRPLWLTVYRRRLAELDFSGLDGVGTGLYRRYSGDFTELGKGELLVWISG